MFATVEAFVCNLGLREEREIQKKILKRSKKYFIKCRNNSALKCAVQKITYTDLIQGCSFHC